MRHNRNTFYAELTPLNNRLKQLRKQTPSHVPPEKDYAACQAKQAAKRARRAARARQGVKP